ncbi:MAG: 16S rRNA (uracil(1498)-N(3))-methyltransferase [Betaproteobacteria bacterium]
MNGPRFYCPVPLALGATVELPENAARHAGKVLRMVEGDSLVLFDGCGGDYAARIASVERKRVLVEVLQWRAFECESPLQITLVQALQSGDKMDLTIQKAVELGVSRIVPVASQRSVLRLDGERAERRLEHWRGVVVAACEQCGRNRLPEVVLPVSLKNWLGTSEAQGAVRLMLAPGGGQTLNSFALPAAQERIELLIGSEGGLSPEELALAESAGFAAMRLGPRVLRTETAGLAAVAAIQCLWGDFREGADHV